MATGSKTTIFYITSKGHTLGQKIEGQLPQSACVPFSKDTVKVHWLSGNRLIFIMATGIVVRTIASLLQDKVTDPAVVVLDEKGCFVMSLTGGHLAGANRLAEKVAEIVGGHAVITTASDINDLPAIDMWARDAGLVIEDKRNVAKAGTKLVNCGKIRIFTDVSLDLPDSFRPVEDPSLADIIVTERTDIVPTSPSTLVLRPRNLVVGIGCNSGTLSEEIETAVKTTLDFYHLSFLSITNVATIDIKGKEPGLAAFAQKHSLSLKTFTAEELNTIPGVVPSAAAKKATGAQAVAEPAALLTAGSGGLLVVNKQRIGNITVALAQYSTPLPLSEETASFKDEPKKGMIYVVGTGPGSADYLTPKALKAIEASDAIVGYGTYLDLIAEIIRGKDTFSTGMAQEIDRCRRAIEIACDGKTVSVISGGDPGIFAMAGLVLELLQKAECTQGQAPDVEIISTWVNPRLCRGTTTV
jgi:cobalt-precorrin 5A hydrolase / precorrin-3B C17-methyltransferase